MISPEFLRLGSGHPDDMLTDAAVCVLAERGAAGLTHRALADWLHVSSARVSQLVSRDRLPFVVTARYVERWCGWVEFRRLFDGVFAMLPSHPAELPGLRVWLALGEIARGREDVAELMDVARRREREALLHIVGAPLRASEVDLVVATTDGLRSALGRTTHPATITEARSTLDALLTLLEVDGCPVRKEQSSVT